MNKKIVSALSGYNFEYYNNHGYGEIEGYEVNVINNAVSNGPVFFISCYMSDVNKNIFTFKLNQAKFSMVKTMPYAFGVAIMIGAMTSGSFAKKFPGVIAEIIEILKTLEAKGKDYSPVTGEEIDVNTSSIKFVDGSIKIRLNNGDLNVINSIIETENAEFNKQPNNYIVGYLGILLGTFAGVMLAFIFALFGFISAWSAVLAVFLGTFFYRKFGGKENAVMIVMSAITTIVGLSFFMFLLYVRASTLLAVEAGLYIEGTEAFKYYMANSPEFKSEFIRDELLSLFFTILGVTIMSIVLAKRVRRPKQIK